MLSNVHALVLGASMAMCVSAPASACSCAGYRTAYQYVQSVDRVFVGRVIKTTPPLTGDPKLDIHAAPTTAFKMLETIKGDFLDTIEVHHPPHVCCICGVSFVPGDEVVVAAVERTPSTLTTNLCLMPRYGADELREALTLESDGDRPLFEFELAGQR